MVTLVGQGDNQISLVREARKQPRDPEFYARIGKKGGERVLKERGYEWFATLGRQGGKTLRERNGPDYFRLLGRRGGLARRKRRTQL